jgi:uncharacterized protein YoxC
MLGGLAKSNWCKGDANIMKENYLKPHREFERLRSRSIRLTILILLIAGFTLLFLGLQGGILSDFLINLAAGFISAALLFLVIDRAFTATNKKIDDEQAIVATRQTLDLIQEQSDKTGAEIGQLLRVSERLQKDLEGKSPSEQLERLKVSINVMRENTEKASALLWYLHQYLAIASESDKETFLNRAIHVPDEIEERARAFAKLLRVKTTTQEGLNILWNRLDTWIAYRDTLIQTIAAQENQVDK